MMCASTGWQDSVSTTYSSPCTTRMSMTTNPISRPKGRISNSRITVSRLQAQSIIPCISLPGAPLFGVSWHLAGQGGSHNAGKTLYGSIGEDHGFYGPDSGHTGIIIRIVVVKKVGDNK